jgi:hypothetical protein
VQVDQVTKVALQPPGRFEFPHSSLMWRHSASCIVASMVARTPPALTRPDRSLAHSVALGSSHEALVSAAPPLAPAARQ